MSISDQSIYNNYIARTLLKPASGERFATEIPKSVMTEVEVIVSESIKANGGKVPKDLYNNVSTKLLPHVGMDKVALSGLLKTTGVFGLVENVNSLSTVGTGLKEQQNLFNAKQNQIERRISKQFETSEDEGLINSMARTASGSPATRDGILGESPDINGPSKPGNWNPPPVEIGSSEISNSGTYVSSVEELEYEMGSTNREISEIIVHWSDTFQNANLNGSDLSSVTGAGSDSYHYIIKRDGTVERGVPISSAGNHTSGHNSYSIGVCLVGGLLTASHDGSSNSSRMDLHENGAQSLTRGQYNTLYQVFRVFFTQYPGGQALGHSEVDPTEDDPGFEVRDYVYNLFNKQSLYKDPQGEDEKSPDEILEAIDGEGNTVNDKDNTLLDQKF